MCFEVTLFHARAGYAEIAAVLQHREQDAAEPISGYQCDLGTGTGANNCSADASALIRLACGG
jgi:hypothetical protein